MEDAATILGLLIIATLLIAVEAVVGVLVARWAYEGNGGDFVGMFWYFFAMYTILNIIKAVWKAIRED